MVIKSKLEGNRGIIVSDAILAILLILLFAGLITSLITNIVLESAKIKMNSQHIDFATEVLEYAEKLSYEGVTEQNLIDYINNKTEDDVSAGTTTDSLTTAYKVAIDVQKYNQTSGNTDKLDIIKIVTVTVTTNLRNKEYSTTISGLKKATLDEVQDLL